MKAFQKRDAIGVAAARAARVRGNFRAGASRLSHARCGRGNGRPRGPAPASRRLCGRRARPAPAGRRCGRAPRAPPGPRYADRTGPRPPPSCRRHGIASCRLRPPRRRCRLAPRRWSPTAPGRVPASTIEGIGASFRAVNRPAMPAPRISAPSVSTILSMACMLHDCFRPSPPACGRSATLARAETPGRTITSCGHGLQALQNAVQRDALHVRAKIAGPHEFHIRIFHRDIVAHRAFGDHHHAAGLMLSPT